MGKIIHINTICRGDAKKIAPSGYTIRKKIGGFIAYQNVLDVPKAPRRSQMKTKMI